MIFKSASGACHYCDMSLKYSETLAHPLKTTSHLRWVIFIGRPQSLHPKMGLFPPLLIPSPNSPLFASWFQIFLLDLRLNLTHAYLSGRKIPMVSTSLLNCLNQKGLSTGLFSWATHWNINQSCMSAKCQIKGPDMNAKFNEHPIGNPRDSQPRPNYDLKKN